MFPAQSRRPIRQPFPVFAGGARRGPHHELGTGKRRDAQVFGITGVNLVPRMPEYVRRLVPLLRQNRLKIYVDRAFSFADAEAAHALARSGDFLGKIVLVPA